LKAANFDMIKAGLLQEENRLRKEKGQSDKTQALLVSSAKHGGSFQGECHNCGRFGHRARDCRSKAVVCHGCGRSGHRVKYCRNKQKKLSETKQREHSATVTTADWRIITPSGVEASSAFTASLNCDDGKQCDGWFIDSGATSHMTHQGQKMRNMTKLKPPIQISAAGVRQKLLAFATGDVQVDFQGGTVLLQNVLFVPQLKLNLISVDSLTQRGHRVLFTREKCVIMREDDEEIKQARRKVNGLFELTDTMPSSKEVQYSGTNVAVNDIKLWHQRLGHLGQG